MSRRLPKYVNGYTDNRGALRHYYRRKGSPRVSLPGLPWSEEFMRALAAAIAGSAPPPAVKPVLARSLRALADNFLECPAFTRLGENDASQLSRRASRRAWQ